ncbi:hypothetical protein A6E01_07985 [Vibrio breoganii]|uniref:Transmembrane protein n=1 Tax=Vibrio breoganii TaxID=553239 RepID=A0AAN0XV83_9VIBR|nr:hypothetical protein [Vibrio breoganii]ANO33151.1 hypothetical protein A6E01_07985 [Vibrio breoganii]
MLRLYGAFILVVLLHIVLMFGVYTPISHHELEVFECSNIHCPSSIETAQEEYIGTSVGDWFVDFDSKKHIKAELLERKAYGHRFWEFRWYTVLSLLWLLYILYTGIKHQNDYKALKVRLETTQSQLDSLLGEAKKEIKVTREF